MLFSAPKAETSHVATAGVKRAPVEMMVCNLGGRILRSSRFVAGVIVSRVSTD